MLETSGTNIGTFRIRSTGYSGNAKQSVVVAYKQASFLDYVYFTQLETSDPVSYGFPNPSAALTGAYAQCELFRREGRMSQPIPNSGGQNCTQIVFVTGDDIDGPLHTNDDLLICGGPSFGRSSADVIEVSAPPTGWSSGCGGGANPNFVGPFATNAPVLTPPPTNGELRNIAGPPATYTGQTTISLSGSSMTITNGGSTNGPLPIPSNGVVYVQNGAGCTSSYSPFTATYPPTSGCGNAVVQGSGYTSQLTIAAENDIIIQDDITRSGNGLLGLIANNFVRIKHPICPPEQPRLQRRHDHRGGPGQLQRRGQRHRLAVEPAHRRRDPRDRPLLHRRPLRLRRLARRARGQRRDRPEVPRRGGHDGRDRIPQGLQLRRPPALPRATAFLRPGRGRLAHPARDARLPLITPITGAGTTHAALKHSSTRADICSR